jgi:tRNA pseudouridine-54 N-methylase
MPRHTPRHQEERVSEMSVVERRRKVLAVAEQLFDTGNNYQLGGNGQPVGIVLVYENEAFINASWGGVPEDRMKSLVDAAAGEGMKDK